MNKRKAVSNILGFAMATFIDTFIVSILTKIIVLFTLKRDSIFIIMNIINVLIFILILPFLLNKKNRIGKYIAERIVEDEKEIITVKDIILTIIIIFLIMR